MNREFIKLIVIGLLFIGVLNFLIRGCGSSSSNEDYSNVGVGVGTHTVASVRGGNIDLSDDLDPSQVPEVVKQAYIKGAKLGKKGKELVKFAISEISQKLSQISTIDLNKDNIPDPILVVPDKGDQESATLSIRVPDPDKVSNYPNDSNAWQDIADNKSIEVLSVTVFPRKGSSNRMDIETRPNQQIYDTRHHHHYYHSSFSHTLLTYAVMRSMFFPYHGWYGPGFYGGFGYYGGGYYGSHYGGRNVSSVRRTRTTYNKSAGSRSAMKTNSGKSVKSSLHNQRSKAASKYKSAAVAKRNSANARKASGFGSRSSNKSSANASKRSQWGGSSARSSRPSSRSSSWGRSPSRSSSWGGGSRGFGK